MLGDAVNIMSHGIISVSALSILRLSQWIAQQLPTDSDMHAANMQLRGVYDKISLIVRDDPIEEAEGLCPQFPIESHRQNNIVHLRYYMRV